MKTQGSVLERCITRFLILFSFLGSGNPAEALSWTQPWENRHHTLGLNLEPKVGFLSSSSNQNLDGDSKPLSRAESVITRSFDLHADYSFRSGLTLFGRISVLDRQVNGSAPRSTLGFADQLLGLSYPAIQINEQTHVFLQFDSELAAYSNDSAIKNGQALLGDGSNNYTWGGFLETPCPHFQSIALEFGLGYSIRSNGFSESIPFRFSLKKKNHLNGLFYHFGILGQHSLETDEAKNQNLLKLRIQNDQNSSIGGSNLALGINPSYFAIHLGAGYALDPDQSLSLALTTPISGTSIANGLQIRFGYSIHFPTPETSELESHSYLRQEAPSSAEQKYDLEAKILSVNDQLYLLKINKGSDQNLEKGQVFDIFRNNIKFAQAQIAYLKDDEAALTVIEYDQDQWIEVGDIARKRVK